MERVKTFIPGFDQLVNGGIPKGFNVLVVGQPGAGKTIFGLQYLYNGAIAGENGLYITLDSREEEIREQAKQFNWDIDALESQKKLFILGIPLNKQTRVNLFTLIEEKIKELGVKRLVFDSLSSMLFNINQFLLDLPILDDVSKLPATDKNKLYEEILSKQEIPEALQKDRPDPKFYKSKPEKRIVYLVMRELSAIGTTNLIIASQPSPTSQGKMTMDGVSEFVSDGIIMMEFQEIAKKAVRSLQIKKMRNTNHELDSYLLAFTAQGLNITEEKAYSGSKISGVNL